MGTNNTKLGDHPIGLRPHTSFELSSSANKIRYQFNYEKQKGENI
jgi:hypothetical protein